MSDTTRRGIDLSQSPHCLPGVVETASERVRGGSAMWKFDDSLRARLQIRPAMHERSASTESKRSQPCTVVRLDHCAFDGLRHGTRADKGRALLHSIAEGCKVRIERAAPSEIRKANAKIAERSADGDVAQSEPITHGPLAGG
jgi:hypothetical protein